MVNAPMLKTLDNDEQDRLPGWRRGLAVVELAVALPVVVLITFATIETCTALYKKQFLEIVAYEGARVGVVPGAESANVIYKCETLLQAGGIADYTIAPIPSDPATLEPGDYFTVEISAPLGPNSLGAIFTSSTLTQRVSLRFD